MKKIVVGISIAWAVAGAVRFRRQRSAPSELDRSESMLGAEIARTFRQIAGSFAFSVFVGGLALAPLFMATTFVSLDATTPKEIGDWWVALPDSLPSGDWTAVFIGTLVLLLALNGFGAVNSVEAVAGAPAALVAKAIVRHQIEGLGWILTGAFAITATAYVEREMSSIPTYGLLVLGAFMANVLGVSSESRVYQWWLEMRRDVHLRRLERWAPAKPPTRITAFRPVAYKSVGLGLIFGTLAAGPAILVRPTDLSTLALVVGGVASCAFFVSVSAYFQVLGQVAKAARENDVRSPQRVTLLVNGWTEGIGFVFIGCGLAVAALGLLVAGGAPSNWWFIVVLIWFALPWAWAWSSRRYHCWQVLVEREGALLMRVLNRSRDFQSERSKPIIGS